MTVSPASTQLHADSPAPDLNMGAAARRRAAAPSKRKASSQVDPNSTAATIEPSGKRLRRALPRGVPEGSELARLYKLHSAGYAAWWSATDEDIVAAHRLTWRSTVYEHYNVSVVREFSRDGTPQDLTFEFRCHLGDPAHRITRRPCYFTGDGTSDLLRDKRRCDERHGIVSTKSVAAIPLYSESLHRTIIALRCAVNKRSFESVVDPLHLLECQVLRQDPDFTLPSPVTVGRDVERMYEGLSPHLSVYFQHRGRVYHLVFDGWTSPINTANLGVSLCYEDKGKIYRTTLDLIRMEGSHTGLNLAQSVANALKKAGIEKWLYFTNGDNAGNCNTAVENLPEFIPEFGGLLDRLRCFTHTSQLCGKTLSSFFRKNYVRRKKALPTPANSNSMTSMGSSTAQPLDYDTLEPRSSEESEDLHELETTLDREETDEEAAARLSSDGGQEEYDRSKVRSLRDRAIADMRHLWHITIAEDEARAAINVLTKLAALAIKVTEPGVLGESFRALIASDSMQQALATDRAVYGAFTTLARRNATRWDSEHRLLKSAMALRLAVIQLTGDPNLKLRAYRLTDREWSLAKDLYDMLAPFEEMTQKFQKADVPLIIEVVPAFTQLQTDLHAMVLNTSLPAVCRVAAYAAHMMATKYVDLFGQCDAYIVAIAMCPERKLSWFKKRGYSEEHITQIRAAVVKRFERFCSRFGLLPTVHPASNTTTTSTAGPSVGDRSTPLASLTGSARWRTSAPTPPVSSTPSIAADFINTYLDTPTVTLPKKTTVLEYWYDELTSDDGIPALAKFGLAMTSAPATAVDIERVFSEGRNQINWNQESMSSQAFRAQMCVASWYSAPWFNLSLANKIIQDSSRALRG